MVDPQQIECFDHALDAFLSSHSDAGERDRIRGEVQLASNGAHIFWRIFDDPVRDDDDLRRTDALRRDHRVAISRRDGDHLRRTPRDQEPVDEHPASIPGVLPRMLVREEDRDRGDERHDRSPEIRTVLVGVEDLDPLPPQHTNEAKPRKNVIARSSVQLKDLHAGARRHVDQVPLGGAGQAHVSVVCKWIEVGQHADREPLRSTACIPGAVEEIQDLHQRPTWISRRTITLDRMVPQPSSPPARGEPLRLGSMDALELGQ